MEMTRTLTTLIEYWQRQSSNDQAGPSPVEDWKTQEFPNDIGNLLDFRRNFLSGGAINAPDKPQESTSILYRNDNIIQRCRNTIILLRRYILIQIYSLQISGNMFRYFPDSQRKRFRKMSVYSNYLMDLSIRMSYYLSAILPLLPKKDEISNNVTKIIEIGGGFGSLAQYVFEKSSNISYILVDLPENLILSYLNFKEAGIPVISIEEYSEGFQGVVLLPGKLLNEIDGCDLVINTMSFQHMSEMNVRYYFKQIFRIGPQFIYLVNRDTKRDVTDIPISKYPKSSAYFLLSQNSIFTKNHIEQVWSLKKST